MQYTLPRNIIIIISYRPTYVITARQIKDESGTVTHFPVCFVNIVIFHEHVTFLVAITLITDALIIVNVFSLRTHYYQKEEANWLVVEIGCNSTPFANKQSCVLHILRIHCFHLYPVFVSTVFGFIFIPENCTSICVVRRKNSSNILKKSTQTC
jgi:hypothetical protein